MPGPSPVPHHPHSCFRSAKRHSCIPRSQHVGTPSRNPDRKPSHIRRKSCAQPHAQTPLRHRCKRYAFPPEARTGSVWIGSACPKRNCCNTDGMQSAQVRCCAQSIPPHAPCPLRADRALPYKRQSRQPPASVRRKAPPFHGQSVQWFPLPFSMYHPFHTTSVFCFVPRQKKGKPARDPHRNFLRGLSIYRNRSLRSFTAQDHQREHSRSCTVHRKTALMIIIIIKSGNHVFHHGIRTCPFNNFIHYTPFFSVCQGFFANSAWHISQKYGAMTHTSPAFSQKGKNRTEI
ncbi:unknown [Clostridium sp. CAG:448]|nr:unknown [Clostridium sp. CAG:448]